MKEKLKLLLNIRIVNSVYQIFKWLKKTLKKGRTAIKAFIYFLYWNFMERIKFQKKLNKKGISSIKCFIPLHWKNGVKYFTANFKGEKVFIKTGGELNLIKREQMVLNYLSLNKSSVSKKIPEVLLCDNDFIVEKFIKGTNLEIEKLSIIERQEVVSQIYFIYSELVANNIRHLDIRPANFMIERKANQVFVYLIDFGMALLDTNNIFYSIPDNHKVRKIICSLGSKYAMKNNSWDDAYSTLMTLKFINPSLLDENFEIWKNLNNDIGKNIVML